MMNEPLSTIMTRDLITLSKNDTLAKANELLKTKRIHHLPVVEDGILIGLITTYDLFKLRYDKEQYDTVKIEEVMTRKLATLEPTDKIGTAAEIFMAHLFHAVPIVEGNKLMGIVTTHDLLKYCFRKEYERAPVV
jgi:acetoin utilization protein AcuB